MAVQKRAGKIAVIKGHRRKSAGGIVNGRGSKE